MTKVYEIDGDGFPIIVWKDVHSDDVYWVQYGAEVSTGLQYDQMTSKLGEAIAHAFEL